MSIISKFHCFTMQIQCILVSTSTFVRMPILSIIQYLHTKSIFQMNSNLMRFPCIQSTFQCNQILFLSDHIISIMNTSSHSNPVTAGVWMEVDTVDGKWEHFLIIISVAWNIAFSYNCFYWIWKNNSTFLISDVMRPVWGSWFAEKLTSTPTAMYVLWIKPFAISWLSILAVSRSFAIIRTPVVSYV